LTSRSILLLGATRLHEGIVEDLRSRGCTVSAFHQKGENYVPRNASVRILHPEGLGGLPPSTFVYLCNERHLQFVRALPGLVDFGGPEPKFIPPDKTVQRRLAPLPVGETNLVLPKDMLVLWRYALGLRDKGFATILKPVSASGGSVGVCRIDQQMSFGDLGSLVGELVREDCGDHFIAEPWVAGDLFCVDGWWDNRPHVLGIGHCDKPSEFSVAIAQITFIHPTEYAELDLLVSKLSVWLRALGYPRGPFHIEFIRSFDELHLVESHYRFGGSVVPEALLLLTGLNCFIWTGEDQQGRIVSRQNLRVVARFGYGRVDLPSPPVLGDEWNLAVRYRFPSKSTMAGSSVNASHRLCYELWTAA